jgi:hypothetical protein
MDVLGIPPDSMDCCFNGSPVEQRWAIKIRIGWEQRHAWFIEEIGYRAIRLQDPPHIDSDLLVQYELHQACMVVVSRTFCDVDGCLSSIDEILQPELGSSPELCRHNECNVVLDPFRTAQESTDITERQVSE